MSFRWLDDVTLSDVAFEATGESLEELFSSAWDAVVSLLVEEPGSIVRREAIPFLREAADPELLLFDVLGEALYLKDAKRFLGALEDVSIERGAPGASALICSARVVGERFDASRHRAHVDVKAITLYRFSVVKVSVGWKATVVVDV